MSENSLQKISLERLEQAGIETNMIGYYLSEGILLPTENERVYEVADVDRLFLYGRELLEDGDFKAANKIFNICYGLEPDNFLVNYQLFYKSLVRRNKMNAQKDIFKYFDVVYDHLKDTERKQDANFYLLLLGYIYGVPDKYNSIFSDIEEDDILLPNDSTKNKMDNKMRIAILANSYHDVNVFLDERFTEFGNNSFEDQLERELLLQTMVKNRTFNRMIYRYIEDDKIKELQGLLNSEDENRFLSKTNQYLLKVVNQYLTIKKSKAVPSIVNESNNTFDAINNNDYVKAYELCAKYAKEKKIGDSALQLMLGKMIDLVENNKNYVNTEPEEIEVEEEKDEVKQLPVNIKNEVDSSIKKLQKGRIAILLRPMPDDIRLMIKDYVDNVDDVVSFNVGSDDERRVVLKYKPYIEKYIDVVETTKEARKCAHRKSYNKAIELYETVLKIGTPRDKTYGEYGLLLTKVGRVKEAVDYLKIATLISQRHSGRIDYTDLIENIEANVKEEDKKPKFVMKDNEFDDEEKVNLDKDFLNDLIGLTQAGEINLFDACKKLNLSEQEINYVKLLYARDCYYLNDIKQGDIYFKQVEKSKEKTDDVKKLMKELQSSKKYYSNRLDEDEKQLIFKRR